MRYLTKEEYDLACEQLPDPNYYNKDAIVIELLIMKDGQNQASVVYFLKEPFWINSNEPREFKWYLDRQYNLKI